jgi:hypothetical protein
MSSELSWQRKRWNAICTLQDWGIDAINIPTGNPGGVGMGTCASTGMART